jgi:predicted permease
MIEQFYDFHSIVFGLVKILLLIGVGYALNRNKLIGKNGVDSLSNLALWACLPALMLSKITSKFIPSAFPGWWLLPLSSLSISALGLCVGYVFQKPFKGFSSGREFMSSCAFQNCGYLPMTLVAFMCSGNFCDRILIYIFLFITGFNLSIWSFVPAFLSKDFKENFRPASLLNPPLVSTVFAVISVFILGTGWIPHIAYDPLKMLGDATFPLVLILLGANLSLYAGHRPENWKVLASCITAKLIVLPVLVFLSILFLSMDPSYKFFILLEACMPSAVSLVIIGYHKKADNRFFSGMIFYSHVFSILTIPLWFTIFKVAVQRGL